MFPDILNDEPSVAANSIRLIATKNIDKESELKVIIFKSKHIDKYPFSLLSGTDFLCYLVACLAWTKIDIGLVNIPHFKSRLSNNMNSILKELSLESQTIIPLSSLEEELCSIIK
ncbi:hypothetical protein [Pseudomonas sp.]|jgi:hypothetical protein|uniref:hypothetical protein n=1 Tax=Pseudomonas sp. TaxID=306 RepID=UPI0028AEC82A|nr:hypothetical protein [Pseudomonas sp.]